MPRSCPQPSLDRRSARPTRLAVEGLESRIALAQPGSVFNPAAPVVTDPAGPAARAAPFATIRGTAAAGCLVQVFADSNHDGILNETAMAVDYQQLAGDATAFELIVPLNSATGNDFLVRVRTSVGLGSPPTVVPTITQAFQYPPTVVPSLSGLVFFDQDGDGIFDPTDFPFFDATLYLDLDHSGEFTAGEPTTRAGRTGSFTFDGLALGGPVAVRLDRTGEDYLRNLVTRSTAVVAPSGRVALGQVLVGVIPSSAVNPLPDPPGPVATPPGGTAAARYVRAIYEAILGRSGSDPEIVAWTATLAAGATDDQVVAAIINSPEHRAAQVASYYRAYLHRAPDARARFWVDRFAGGASEQDVSRGILNSPEYQTAHPDLPALARALAVDVLDGISVDSQVAALLAAATGPADLIDRAVNSTSGNLLITRSLYIAHLHRTPEGTTSDIWDDLLAQGISAGAVTTGILTSPEFHAAVEATSTRA